MSENTEQMTVYWPDGEKDNIQAPVGFKDSLKWFLDAVYKATGYKCSRNEFLMKSARFYLDHLLQAKNTKRILNSLKETGGGSASGDTNLPPDCAEKG
jgi:hypothetical protein